MKRRALVLVKSSRLNTTRAGIHISGKYTPLYHKAIYYTDTVGYAPVCAPGTKVNGLDSQRGTKTQTDS